MKPIPLQGKMNGKGLGGQPLHVEKLGFPSCSGVTPLEVLVYGDVNMTGVDCVKAI